METETVLQFEQLSDEAKQRAREWWLEGFEFEPEYESFETAAKILGITFNTHEVKLMNGKTRHEVNIWWSGFWSQGDGACFTGSYKFEPGCAEAIRKEFPTDSTLHEIADSLMALQCRLRLLEGKSMNGIISQNDNRYSHSGMMSVTATDDEGDELSLVVSNELQDSMRSFADWIYRSLEEEYHYQTSDEAVDETIIANEYEFDEDGECL